MKNLLSAQMNELVSIDSSTSIWIALLLRQVKITPHRFEFAAPPHVFLVLTNQGPKTSKPTLVKGGATSVLLVGKSAICCSEDGLLTSYR